MNKSMIRDFPSLAVGDELPELAFGPISRTTLALFAGASGDHNPIHIDIDFAKSAGFNDVFVHGMLVMAYLGRLLDPAIAANRLRQFNARFVAITQIKEQIRCCGKVVEKVDFNGEPCIKVELVAKNAADEIKISCSAIIAMPE